MIVPVTDSNFYHTKIDGELIDIMNKQLLLLLAQTELKRYPFNETFFPAAQTSGLCPICLAYIPLYIEYLDVWSSPCILGGSLVESL